MKNGKRMTTAEMLERVQQWCGSFPTAVNDQITDAVTQAFWSVTQDQELLDELIARRDDHVREMNETHPDE